MISLKGEVVFRGIVVLAQMHRKWTMEPQAGRQPFDQHQFEFYLQCAKDLADALEASELPIAASHAKGLADALDKATIEPDGKRVVEGRNISYATHHLDRLIGVVAEEAGTKLFLSMPTQSKDTYEPKSPLFGQDIAQKFPSVAYEVDEAGKCLALERSTAAAFHAIRCLEAGIRALSRCLQIPDPTKAHERSWAKLLAAVKDAIDKKWPTNSARMSGDGEFFDNSYAALAAMQNPWRNATMHLDQKYTPEEAKHIFEIVRGFMMKIASRMDENGYPNA